MQNFWVFTCNQVSFIGLRHCTLLGDNIYRMRPKKKEIGKLDLFVAVGQFRSRFLRLHQSVNLSLLHSVSMDDLQLTEKSLAY